MAGSESEEFVLLKRKVEVLINDYKRALDELEKTRSEIHLLNSRLGTSEGELTEIKREFEKVRLSGAILGDRDESHVAKKRINELVREIDNCIALLNNI